MSQPYILYIVPGEQVSEKAIDIVRMSNLQVHLQDVNLIKRPEWLNGVPILAQRQSGHIWKGTRALHQLKFLTQNVTIQPGSSNTEPVKPWNNYQSNLDLQSHTPSVPVTNVPQPVQPTNAPTPTLPSPIYPSTPTPPTPPVVTPPSQPSTHRIPTNVSGVEVRPAVQVPTIPQPLMNTKKSNPNELQPLPPPDVNEEGEIINKIKLPPMVNGFSKPEVKTVEPGIPTEPVVTKEPRIPPEPVVTKESPTLSESSPETVNTTPSVSLPNLRRKSKPPQKNEKSRRVSHRVKSSKGEGFTPSQLNKIESLIEHDDDEDEDENENNGDFTRRDTIVIPDNVKRRSTIVIPDQNVHNVTVPDRKSNIQVIKDGDNYEDENDNEDGEDDVGTS